MKLKYSTIYNTYCYERDLKDVIRMLKEKYGNLPVAKTGEDVENVINLNDYSPGEYFGIIGVEPVNDKELAVYVNIYKVMEVKK